jgi:hypothetical protein
MIAVELFKQQDWHDVESFTEPFLREVQDDKFFEELGNGVALTAKKNGKVMACGGIMYAPDGEGVTWLKASRECLKSPVTWTRTFRDGFRMMQGVMDVKAVCYVLKGFCEGGRVARLIGMKTTGEEVEQNGKTFIKYMAV